MPSAHFTKYYVYILKLRNDILKLRLTKLIAILPLFFKKDVDVAIVHEKP